MRIQSIRVAGVRTANLSAIGFAGVLVLLTFSNTKAIS